MTIYEYKAQFEEAMKLAELLPQTAVEQAWLYFKSSIKQPLDEDFCEELGFVAGKCSWHDGELRHDEIFSVYFGRLIDNEKRSPWDVADINCHFLYEMNDELRQFDLAIEDAYGAKDDEAKRRRKIEAIFAFADEKQQLWSLLRHLTPIKTYMTFWLF